METNILLNLSHLIEVYGRRIHKFTFVVQVAANNVNGILVLEVTYLLHTKVLYRTSNVGKALLY